MNVLFQARKLTAQNENDMLGYIGYEDDGEKVEYTRDLCDSLSKHMMHVKDLPHECMKFSDIVHFVEANDKDLTHPTSYMS